MKMDLFQKIINMIINRMRVFVNNGTAKVLSKPHFMTRIFVNRGAHLEIGMNTSIQPYTVVNVGRKVSIGSDVMVSPHCFISDFQHDFKLTGKERMESMKYMDCVIDDGAWIGFGSVIIGSKIGKNAVIGANSTLINKDIKDDHLFFGDSRLEQTPEQLKIR